MRDHVERSFSCRRNFYVHIYTPSSNFFRQEFHDWRTSPNPNCFWSKWKRFRQKFLNSRTNLHLWRGKTGIAYITLLLNRIGPRATETQAFCWSWWVTITREVSRAFGCCCSRCSQVRFEQLKILSPQWGKGSPNSNDSRHRSIVNSARILQRDKKRDMKLPDNFAVAKKQGEHCSNRLKHSGTLMRNTTK